MNLFLWLLSFISVKIHFPFLTVMSYTSPFFVHSVSSPTYVQCIWWRIKKYLMWASYLYLIMPCKYSYYNFDCESSELEGIHLKPASENPSLNLFMLSWKNLLKICREKDCISCRKLVDCSVQSGISVRKKFLVCEYKFLKGWQFPVVWS